jgi:hypothetical protein
VSKTNSFDFALFPLCLPKLHANKASQDHAKSAKAFSFGEIHGDFFYLSRPHFPFHYCQISICISMLTLTPYIRERFFDRGIPTRERGSSDKRWPAGC